MLAAHFVGPTKTKINLFGADEVQHVWSGPGQDSHSDGPVPTSKHGGGSVSIWGRLRAKGVREMTYRDGSMNACLHVRPNVVQAPGSKRNGRWRSKCTCAMPFRTCTKVAGEGFLQHDNDATSSEEQQQQK